MTWTLPADSDLSAIAVFNVLDSDYCGGMVPDSYGAAMQNACALQAAIDEAARKGGGMILIPSGTYYIAGPIYVGANASPQGPVSLTILGTSGNTTLIQTTASHNLFQIDTNVGSGDNIGGVTLQDLLIQYPAGATSGTAVAIAEMFSAQDVRLFRLTFLDCPRAVRFEDTLQCSMLECSIVYESNFPNPAAVTIGASQTSANETYIASCMFTNSEQSPPGADAIALKITACDRVRVVDSTITGFQQGIVIAPTHTDARHLYFGNLSVFTTSADLNTGAALFIQPANDGQADATSVTRVQCVACIFAPDPTLGTDYSSGGIYVEQQGGNNIVDQVRFVSCCSSGWPGPGLQIVKCSNVEILGGTYACNGTQAESPPSNMQAGILVSNASSNVRIIGTACGNSIAGALATQEYGIVVTGPLLAKPTNIFARGCDLKGNLAAAVDIEFATNVQVTNCAGYNDQAKILAVTAPTPSGSTITNASLQYYGPVAFYVSGGTTVTITIDGHATGLTSGSFNLGPGESATLSWGVTAPSFLAVGK